MLPFRVEFVKGLQVNRLVMMTVIVSPTLRHPWTCVGFATSTSLENICHSGIPAVSLAIWNGMMLKEQRKPATDAKPEPGVDTRVATGRCGMPNRPNAVYTRAMICVRAFGLQAALHRFEVPQGLTEC